MMKYFVCLVLLIGKTDAYCQAFTPDLEKWDSRTIKIARRFSSNLFSSKSSNDVVFYTNLARMDGALFVSTILKPYCKFYGDTAYTPYLQSLIVHLSRLKKSPPLRHRLWLSIMAKIHARKSGIRGYAGHHNLNRRLWINGKLRKGYGENCSYGEGDPLGVVVQLLIDEDVPSLGHRFNITSTEFKRIGVSFAKHRKYGINCVQEFSF